MANADKSGRFIDVTGQTFVGLTTLAQRIGVDRDTIDAELQRLHVAGIATIQGKHGRSYICSIMLPCSHLDMYSESCADNYADTSPHCQCTINAQQDQEKINDNLM